MVPVSNPNNNYSFYLVWGRRAYGVSLKVKHSIRSSMRCITKQNAIRGTRFKFVQISTLQDKAHATKRPEMRDERLASKAKLKWGQIQDQA
jgi:hypothetical protein